MFSRSCSSCQMLPFWYCESMLQETCCDKKVFTVKDRMNDGTYTTTDVLFSVVTGYRASTIDSLERQKQKTISILSQV